MLGLAILYRCLKQILERLIVFMWHTKGGTDTTATDFPERVYGTIRTDKILLV